MDFPNPLPLSSAPVGLLGAVLGQKYKVLRLIGEGGMGTVFEAEHLLIGKRVAVKLLRPEFAHSCDVVRRFHREAQAASRIGHVNIIEVTDLGVTDDGTPFLVMEYLDGEPLSRVLDREHTLSPGRAADIVGQTLAALAAAHEKGIVHRDLKPENIFLVNHGGRPDFVKLLDFGISKFQTMTGDGRLTTTGVALGTPYYMAPEQAAGSSDIDHRVDIYALGAVLYELLTGRPPYQGSNYNALLAQIITNDPPAPSSLREDLDPALERLIQTAMNRNPERRFQSAPEMLEALIPFGASRTPFERPSSGTQAGRDERRRQAFAPTVPTPVSGRSIGPGLEAPPATTHLLDLTPPGRTTRAAAAGAGRGRKTAVAVLLVGSVAIVGVWYALRGDSGTTTAADVQAGNPGATVSRPAGTIVEAAEAQPPSVTGSHPDDPDPPVGAVIQAAAPVPPLPAPPVASQPGPSADTTAGTVPAVPPDGSTDDAGAAVDAAVAPSDAGPRDAPRRGGDAGRRVPDATAPWDATESALISVHGYSARTDYDAP